jgi:hypothetical protein
MFIDMAFGSPIYERLRALGLKNVYETNFGRRTRSRSGSRRPTRSARGKAERQQAVVASQAVVVQ